MLHVKVWSTSRAMLWGKDSTGRLCRQLCPVADLRINCERRKTHFKKLYNIFHHYRKYVSWPTGPVQPVREAADLLFFNLPKSSHTSSLLTACRSSNPGQDSGAALPGQCCFLPLSCGQALNSSASGLLRPPCFIEGKVLHCPGCIGRIFLLKSGQQVIR